MKCFLRNTRQRDLIQRIFGAAERPLSPDEVYAEAVAQRRRLSLATVYRNVAKLVEEGWLVVVDLPGRPPRYEVSGKKHHHHFLCRECDALYDLNGCIGEFKALAPRGFRVESHDITLHGVCKSCRSNRRRKPRPERREGG